VVDLGPFALAYVHIELMVYLHFGLELAANLVRHLRRLVGSFVKALP